MGSSVNVAQIQENPFLIATSFRLPSSTVVAFRPLARNDAPALGRYFVGLSDETRRRFGPHALDQTTADQLCATIDPAITIRMVAVLEDSAQGQIIAYFILNLSITDAEQSRYRFAGISLDAHTDCTVAPSVADAFQNQKLGSPLMTHLIQVARSLGRKRMVLLGGTQVSNSRAVHFYKKHGFRTLQTFEYPAGCDNYDMLLEL